MSLSSVGLFGRELIAHYYHDMIRKCKENVQESTGICGILYHKVVVRLVPKDKRTDTENPRNSQCPKSRCESGKKYSRNIASKKGAQFDTGCRSKLAQHFSSPILRSFFLHHSTIMVRQRTTMFTHILHNCYEDFKCVTKIDQKTHIVAPNCLFSDPIH